MFLIAVSLSQGICSCFRFTKNTHIFHTYSQRNEKCFEILRRYSEELRSTFHFPTKGPSKTSPPPEKNESAENNIFASSKTQFLGFYLIRGIFQIPVNCFSTDLWCMASGSLYSTEHILGNAHINADDSHIQVSCSFTRGCGN